MKTFLTTALVTTALGATAFAGSVSLDARTDFEVNQYNDAAETAQTLRDNHRFTLQTLRLDFKGNMSEETSYRLRFRLNRPFTGATTATANNSRDNLNQSVDFAYIQHKFTDALAFQMGKFNTDIGGVEGLTSGADLYFTSESYGEQNPIRYATGAKAIYTIADQELNFMVTNQQVDADANGTTGGGFNQNREAWGVVYKGNFMDKTLMPVLSYHEDNIQATDTTGAAAFTDRKFAYAGAGLKYDFAPIFVELDYLYNTFRNRTIADETDKVTSIIASVGTRMDNWVGRLKYENSEEETFTAAATSGRDRINGYQAVVEYLPTNDKNLRYHLAYVQKDIKPETGDTRTSQTALVGMRLFADFLK